MRNRPNIVFILADDLGYGDLNCYGADEEHIRTPNLDRIARQGVRFTDAHSPSSVCTPSRYNFMTGRYCWRTWAKTGCIWAHDPCLIEEDRPTVASVLRSGGYATGMVGKWHLGFGAPGAGSWDDIIGPDYNRPLSHGPLTCGFETFYGVPHIGQRPHFYIDGNMVKDLESGDPIRIIPDPRPEFLKKFFERPRTCNPNLKVEGGKRAEYRHEEVAVHLTEKAVDWLEAQTRQPFFLYFAHRNVHAPLIPHPRFSNTSAVGDYGDFIHELDWSVGEILKTLDRLGLSENTIVFFASDNGATERHRPTLHVDYNGHRANGVLRGQKTEVYEGGHRIPFIARWPGRIPAGTTCGHLLALTDILATCAELAGIGIPQGASPDGVSFAASLLDRNARPARETLIHDSMMKAMFAVRHREWKLIIGQGGGGIGYGWPGVESVEHFTGADPKGQLFNLAGDLGEETNLYDRHPDIVSELSSLLEKEKQRS
ncbi:MAG TPA: hypothetical protein DCZ94_14600 [Lentisphaeria bacterium]|nr:MAG: hypothetical protein A2X48_09975 [Lentisphaerae bacterium GWF2_49_21]HBC88177.1 hypothetical protein [Lentisphaeria bacterium]